VWWDDWLVDNSFSPDLQEQSLCVESIWYEVNGNLF